MTFSVPSSEEELEKAVASITNGECEDIIRQKRLLESIRSKKLQHIEAVKAAQMRNLNDIYEYEVEEANSTFKSEMESFTKNLIQLLKNEYAKLQAEKNTSNNRSLRSADITSSELAPPKTTKRKINSGLDKTLSESDVRNDFIEIVEDLETRARRFVKRARRSQFYPQKKVYVLSGGQFPSKIQELIPKEFQVIDTLVIDDIFFPVGSLVSIYSNLSNETFSAVIVHVDDNMLLCRCGSGTRIKIYLDHIRAERVTIAASEECYSTLSTASEAMELLSMPHK